MQDAETFQKRIFIFVLTEDHGVGGYFVPSNVSKSINCIDWRRLGIMG